MDYTAPHSLSFDSFFPLIQLLWLGPRVSRAYPFRCIPNVCVQKSIYIKINIIGGDHDNGFKTNFILCSSADSCRYDNFHPCSQVDTKV